METRTCSNCGRGGIGEDELDCPFCDDEGDDTLDFDEMKSLKEALIIAEELARRSNIREKRKFSHDDKRIQKKRQKNPNQKKFKKHFHLNF
ncbi:hypothetical protein A2645_01510 [Candidatus Nomurabacteria bacterium RIFCSPHIGHO2_01_FULL_39_9]|uniref:Uncharacterized protein n=1 Tax=Candidatus Nomurabacteria bacterium RIFCSPHIGHO2_01_FULL_39_9 TaxID=1801735 RepID=A0A1F6UVK0_9BACT|nr:MAG: hypothetical protein A2645_01510 [Candidatus Nomurabacteria bacterium RIFCSPHIGHO2_01_FULL_39_9]